MMSFLHLGNSRVSESLANMRWDHFALSQSAKWRVIADRLDTLAAIGTEGPPLGRIETAVAALELNACEVNQRAHHRPAAAGMPTREPLLELMRKDSRGVLGIIRFLDFDRLCAFDPALGDRLLQAVAERVSGMLPPQRLLAQVDRAHLAIWFGPDATDGSARSEMEAIKYALSEALEIGDRTILPKLCSQIGEVISEDPGTALTRMLAQLTIATSPSCHSAGQDDSGVAEREGFSFEQDLKLAVGRGELRLCYQPLIDARNVRTCGAEALIRWHHPCRGHVPPGQFVPIMEAAGLAHEFGMWSLNTAAREARAWQTYGLSGLRVAVNVSGHQLEREDLAKLLGRTLERHALPPSALEIELTEGVAMVDCERAARLFADIRAMGVAIAIDDFGTGYSSLSTLRKLAFDKIKIDREFVNDVDRRKDSQAICHSIIALARGLGISVLAEGVERPEEYGWLRAHGCNFFQGYFFSPPLEASAFTAFVENTQGLSAKLSANARALQQTISERLSA